VTRRADVVFPVAAVAEKSGTFLDWEGQARTFETVLHTTAMSDARILDTLAREFGVELNCASPAEIRREMGHLPPTRAQRPGGPATAPGQPARPGRGEAVLATWSQLIDNGRLTEGDAHLLGTARVPVARVSPATAAALGLADGEALTVGTERGAVTLPALVTPDLPDEVVWLPTNSPGSTVRRTLGVTSGALVRISLPGGTR
jgi:NADH-quinone oxidoreductase subunit G